MGLIIKFIVKY